jgi:hypothetical protein
LHAAVLHAAVLYAALLYAAVLNQETPMPRASKSPPTNAATPVIPPSKTSHLFSTRKANDRTPMTHEAIAADIEAFRKAGGTIEVLGVTRALHRIGPDAIEGASKDDAPATPAKKP